ncbi:MAG: SGNH/GDSL hydrolase family protein [Planctomycetota bacterium]
MNPNVTGSSGLPPLDPNFAVSQPGSDLLWHDASQLTVEGQGWQKEQLKRRFDRLPATAEGVVRRDVWELSRQSAGIEIRFVSDATEIGARWTVLNQELAFDHMPATGVSGLDLYARDGQRWRWIGVGRPTQYPTNQVSLVKGVPVQGLREFRLYLPLYNGIEQVMLGVPKGAVLQAAPARSRLPVVVYGTSLTQGGCASRPGMAYTSILSRSLDCAVVNLGFSGNGLAEPEVAQVIAGMATPAAFVLDQMGNVSAAMVRERMPYFIATLRAQHPRTPIVLVENFVYQNEWLYGPDYDRSSGKNGALKEIATPLMQHDPLVSYVCGKPLLGDDGEATVDGVHPTDLGFMRMAQTLYAPISKMLARRV